MILNSVIGLMGSNFDPDALLYWAQLTVQPSSARKIIDNQLFKDLKGIGNVGAFNNFNQLNRLWIHATELRQHGRVSLRYPSSTQITEVNSPTHTVNQGFAGNGSTSYLKTNFTPSINGIEYTLNSGSIFVYCRTNLGEASIDMGVNDSGVNASYIVTKFSDGNSYGKLNNSAGLFISVATADSRGLFSSRRTASNAIALFRNGASIQTAATASTGLPAFDFFICGNSTGGLLVSASTKQYAISAIGSGSIDHASFYAALQAHATSVGYNV